LSSRREPTTSAWHAGRSPAQYRCEWKQQSVKVWFPTIRTGSGSDVFTRQLAGALTQIGVETSISWFPHYFEFVPDLLGAVRPPIGTDLIHANSWTGFAFRRSGIPLVVTNHLCVHDPAFARYKTISQKIYHACVI